MRVENDLSEVWDAFAFTEEEQEVYPFARTYMRHVEPERERILTQPELRRRFMLVGLFPSYRAASHGGGSMSTDTVDVSPHVYTDERLQIYLRYTSERIVGTQSYLEKIGRWPRIMIIAGMGRRLARFVLSG